MSGKKMTIKALKTALKTMEEEELQAVVNSADMSEHLESARAYGLVTGGPEIDQKRIDLVLEAGRKRKVVPNWGNPELRLFLANMMRDYGVTETEGSDRS